MFTKNIPSFRILTLFCVFSCSVFDRPVTGFRQELWLYEENGNGLDFQSQVADASLYNLVLPKVTRYCARGIWYIYREKNFSKPLFKNGLGLPFTDNVTCGNNINVSNALSFRYWGASDTDIPAISLYTEDYYGGDEILVTGTAYAGITSEIKSIAVTGSSDWTLFEGSHLDGKSICYTVPVAPGYFFNFNRVRDLKIKKIRSVFKGCDLDQANAFRSALL